MYPLGPAFRYSTTRSPPAALLCRPPLCSVGVKTKNKNGNDVYRPNIGPAVPERCPECGSGYAVGGPIWSDPIHDMDFVKALKAHLQARKDLYPSFNRIHPVVTNVSEELPDVPLSFDLADMTRMLGVTSPKIDLLRSAIANAGFRCVEPLDPPMIHEGSRSNILVFRIIYCSLSEFRTVSRRRFMNSSLPRHSGSPSRVWPAGFPARTRSRTTSRRTHPSPSYSTSCGAGLGTT